MKNFNILICCLLFVSTVNSQNKFLTKNGAVSFFSSTSMEDIKADNNQVLSIIDTSNGDMAISILMKSFMFKKALMQEHFNENYLESDKFPKATFKGTILNFEVIKTSGTRAEVTGTIDLHGKSKEISIQPLITITDETILLEGEFYLELEDFDIKIPAVVSKNIAKKVMVSFTFNHKPYKK